MRMECFVEKMCPKCEECDDWILVDEDEETKSFEVECANCNCRHILKFKVMVKQTKYWNNSCRIHKGI